MKEYVILIATDTEDVRPEREIQSQEIIITMETGESSTHLSVSRTSTVDSTTSNDSSFDDPQQEQVKGERSLQRGEHCEINNIPGEARRPSIGLRETKIIISQDDSVTIDNEGVVEDEEDETRKRSESLHKLHQQHALDSWDQEGNLPFVLRKKALLLLNSCHMI